MTDTILCDKGDERKIIEEEKADWVVSVLVALGAEKKVLEELSDIDLADYLYDKYKIEIWSNLTDESVTIERNDKVVAEWKKPTLILFKNKKETYYEIKLNAWALPFQMNEF